MRLGLPSRGDASRVAQRTERHGKKWDCARGFSLGVEKGTLVPTSFAQSNQVRSKDSEYARIPRCDGTDIFMVRMAAKSIWAPLCMKEPQNRWEPVSH